MRLPDPGPLEQIHHPAAKAAGVTLYCKRDDQYSPAPGTALQGNKVRKLSRVIKQALATARPPLLVSFGGAFSNHLSALATAGRLYQIPVVVYVRGEEVDNPILSQAEKDGAHLIKLSRSEYRRKGDDHWVTQRRRELSRKFDRPESQIWFIPEGGTTALAIASMADLYREISNQLGRTPSYVCVSAGTGGTAAGLILGANPATRIEVYPALKGSWMTGVIQQWLPADHAVQWSCVPDYHFGGYGRFPSGWVIDSPGRATRALIGPELPPLEPVYTAKLFAGVLDRLAKGVYPEGSTVVLIHTGGIY